MLKRSILNLTLTLVLAAAGFAAVHAQTAEAAVKAFVGGCRLGPAEGDGKLEIVPVEAPAASLPGGVLTLDDALAAKALTVSEVSESGSVNTLRVTNRSKQAVFIMAGEILAGSKQNRILQVDVLLPPGAVDVSLQAFCVEHGRWTYKSKEFYSERNAAPISVRRVAQQGKAQGEVWQEVACNNAAVGTVSGTGSLSDSFNTKKVRETKDRLAKRFGDLPARCPRATGVVVRIDGKVLAADLFADRRLFEKLWDKMLESYLVEYARRMSGEAADGAAATAADFLRRVAGARVDLDPAPSAGRTVELFAPALSGAGVLRDGAPVHLALFPTDPDAARKAPRTPLQRNYPPNSVNQGPVQQQR
ncbi:MAG: hypothetical protein KA419_17005 [Acidobacteria bacterium]|nr:hypothetical protein [Acidobacteriota bacterium]